MDTTADFQTVELPTLLTEEQAHGLVSHIWDFKKFKGMRTRKQGPRYARLAGAVFYSRADVVEWFNRVVNENVVDVAAKSRKPAKAKPKASNNPKPTTKTKAKADELV